MSDSKHRWARRIRRILAVVILLLAAAVVSGKFWVGPAVIRSRIRKHLPDYWNGSVEIDEVEFNYFSPIRLRGVSLKDSAARQWARVDRVEIVLSDWPGTHPIVTGIEVVGAELRAHFTDGRCRPPIPPGAAKPSWFDEYVDLQRVSVRDATAAMLDEAGNEAALENLSALLQREKGSYRLTARWDPSGAKAALDLLGRVELPGGAAEVVLGVDHTFDKARTAAVIKILQLPAIGHAEGRLSGKVTITGNVGDPYGFRPAGTIRLERGSVATHHGEWVRELAASVRLGGKADIRVLLSELEAESCEGTVAGKAAAALRPGPTQWGLDYSGEVHARDLAVPELLQALTGKRHTEIGAASADVGFTGSGWGREGLTAKGTAHIADADVPATPFGRQLFGFLEIDLEELAGGTDIEVAFVMAWPRAVVQGQMGTNISALAVEPGGKVNLETKEVDFYVVAGVLNDIKNLFVVLRIPLLEAPARLVNKLTRVRVKGRWTDPPAKLIRKEPVRVEDLGAGTIELLGEVVGGGERLGNDVLKTFRRLFGVLGGKEAPATRPTR